jgi:hypothetical protein
MQPVPVFFALAVEFGLQFAATFGVKRHSTVTDEVELPTKSRRRFPKEHDSISVN